MNTLPPPCKGGCGRPLRPARTPKNTYPMKTWATHARGMCSDCYKNRDSNIVEKRPDNCVGCGRPLRSNKATLKKCPGTVRHVGHGVCESCHRDRKPRRTTWVDNCHGCDYPLRPRGVSEEERPGTRIYDARGLCSSCNGKRRRGTLDIESHPAPERIPEITDPALLRLMSQRQERIRRQQQVQRVRTAQEAARRRFIQSRQAA